MFLRGQYDEKKKCLKAHDYTCLCGQLEWHVENTVIFFHGVYLWPRSLFPCRGVFVLAAALRQYVLPPRCSASLYDPTDDEWMFESQGKLPGVCAVTTPFRVSKDFFLSWLSFSPPPHSSPSPCVAVFLCISLALTFNPHSTDLLLCPTAIGR